MVAFATGQASLCTSGIMPDSRWQNIHPHSSCPQSASVPKWHSLSPKSHACQKIFYFAYSSTHAVPSNHAVNYTKEEIEDYDNKENPRKSFDVMFVLDASIDEKSSSSDLVLA
ncbi:hypothetical protein RF11_13375 [Thelohanellus kitauei]|uniref:Uncharacterized protein n=1 Tax=Thelohanellus kitauei TaxID=669202 RepID=A0A0C2ICG3_THEKT|nr:hypothetical protein RF11_13375 [Thelohanellus kitauei]